MSTDSSRERQQHLRCMTCFTFTVLDLLSETYKLIRFTFRDWLRFEQPWTYGSTICTNILTLLGLLYCIYRSAVNGLRIIRSFEDTDVLRIHWTIRPLSSTNEIKTFLPSPRDHLISRSEAKRYSEKVEKTLLHQNNGSIFCGSLLFWMTLYWSTCCIFWRSRRSTSEFCLLLVFSVTVYSDDGSRLLLVPNRLDS